MVRTERRLIITLFLTIIIHSVVIYWVHNTYVPGTVLSAEDTEEKVSAYKISQSTRKFEATNLNSYRDQPWNLSAWREKTWCIYSNKWLSKNRSTLFLTGSNFQSCSRSNLLETAEQLKAKYLQSIFKNLFKINLGNTSSVWHTLCQNIKKILWTWQIMESYLPGSGDHDSNWNN